MPWSDVIQIAVCSWFGGAVRFVHAHAGMHTHTCIPGQNRCRATRLEYIDLNITVSRCDVSVVLSTLKTCTYTLNACARCLLVCLCVECAQIALTNGKRTQNGICVAPIHCYHCCVAKIECCFCTVAESMHIGVRRRETDDGEANAKRPIDRESQSSRLIDYLCHSRSPNKCMGTLLLVVCCSWMRRSMIRIHGFAARKCPKMLCLRCVIGKFVLCFAFVALASIISYPMLILLLLLLLLSGGATFTLPK